MNNLYTVFKLSDRAYLFDNTSGKSNNSFNFFVEKNGNNIYLSNSNIVPQWFDEFVLRRIWMVNRIMSTVEENMQLPKQTPEQIMKYFKDPAISYTA